MGVNDSTPRLTFRMKLFNTLDFLTDALGNSDGQHPSDVRQELLDEGIDVDKSLEHLKLFRETIAEKAKKKYLYTSVLPPQKIGCMANEIHLKLLAYLQDESGGFDVWWAGLSGWHQEALENGMIECIEKCLRDG